MKYWHIFLSTMEVIEVTKLCDFDQVMEIIQDLIENGVKITRIEESDKPYRRD